MSAAGPEKDERADVAICVASYRRPEGLSRLLGGIAGLALPAGLRLEVHVADNDPEGSARAVVEAARGWLEAPIEYRLEPRRGIPQARNATLASALGRAVWLAFIDDDELPDPAWLARLLETQRATGAEVVTGPVVARFESPPPDWVAAGGFFDSPRLCTGREVPTAYTNNALVRADALARQGGGFDERFPMGEDTELFERLRAAGAHIVWSDEAVVYDHVPSARCTARWVIARGFHMGAARTHIERRHRPRSALPRALARGTRRLTGGLAGALLARDRAGRVRGLQRAAVGVGRFAGLLGLR